VNLQSEWRAFKRFRYQYLHLKAGNWWRWPVAVFARIPLWFILQIVNVIYISVEWLINQTPGVKQRPTKELKP
jgi:hypothetical protein